MLFSIAKLIVYPLFRALFSVEHHGVENVPEEGAVIIAGNHPSYLDPLLVGLPIKRRIRFMAWDALFRIPLLGQIIKAVGAFPVDIRKGRGEAAYRQALRVLESGEALGVFPEGQRSDQAAMGDLRAGVARLAIETGAPIVPVTIGGAMRAWPKWKLLPRSAKIVVRYHEPIRLSEEERAANRDNREFQRQVTERVAMSVNRSLLPSIRGAESLERWYHQPPSHVRSYEWAPALATLITVLVAWRRGTLPARWLNVILPPAIYYAYIMADLALIKPNRLAKWLRNSAPIWMILAWHYPLTSALILPAGDRNDLLVAAALAAFFPFFYEDYYTLQKFVRGVVVSYYFSLAISLAAPHGLGTLVAVLGFITIFVLWRQVIYRKLIAAVMLASVALAVGLSDEPRAPLLIYAALSLATIGYLQAFVTIAYDIRKAGNVSLK
ncbi:MAG TPA: lysophospholipid acyltransferase family protein [Blastocatellia bacterium]|jgi:1-acyl-sn-glycerol-3-phosphate acyltransferase|nr:lysophospholipid acyltransferase family protein [Blastocatellia bacterium]